MGHLVLPITAYISTRRSKTTTKFASAMLAFACQLDSAAAAGLAHISVERSLKHDQDNYCNCISYASPSLASCTEQNNWYGCVSHWSSLVSCLLTFSSEPCRSQPIPPVLYKTPLHGQKPTNHHPSQKLPFTIQFIQGTRGSRPIEREKFSPHSYPVSPCPRLLPVLT